MNKQEALEVLDGLILGDGGITRLWRSAWFYMSMSKHTISIEDHLKYEYWLRDNVFTTLGIKATVKLREATSRNQVYLGRKYEDRKYQYAYLWTESVPLLADCWDEWHSGGEWKKDNSHTRKRGASIRLPERFYKDFMLSTSALTHWFLGDGDSSRDKRYLSIVNTGFSTDCFNKAEIHHLMNMLNNIGILTIKPSGQRNPGKGSGLSINLAQQTVDDFMDLVAPHILEIFHDSESPSYKDIIKYKAPYRIYNKRLRRPKTYCRKETELDKVRNLLRR